MAKKFAIPFAQDGDKAAVPDALQPDGSVSYTTGFGPDYELDKDLDPVNAKDVPRDQTNQLFNDLTGAVGEVQLLGYSEWSADLSPYPLNARVALNDKVWRSNVAVNNGTPGVDPEWEDVSESSQDFLNTLRIDVASASTVNLTTAAPDTRHINITGTTTIDGFTVAAGQCYFVRFNAALTLTNGASLVTNRGANISVAAGDTCIIRATAANSVEILCGDFLSEAALATIGQTWQNVTLDRAASTTYTNTTGRPIQVMITANWSDNVDNYNFFVDGVAVLFDMEGGLFGWSSPVTAIVPAGSTYSISANFASPIKRWMELR